MFINFLAFCLLASHAYVCASTCQCSGDHGDAYCPEPKVYKVDRPCPKFDICCIRKYFFENGHCKVPQSKTSSLTIDREFLPLPSFNVTLLQEQISFCGSNDAKVTEFYVNPETDIVLLTLRFGPMTISGVNRVIQQEPRKEFTISDAFNITGTYDYVQTTTQFKGVKRVELRGSKTHTDVPLPNVSTCCNKKDEQNVMDQDLATTTIEMFVPRGYALARYWIQRFICDYGVDPVEPILTTF